MTRELQRVIQAMAAECDDTYEMENSIEDMLEEIFDNHEAQLKAKDEITQDIKEAYELKSIAYDLLLEAIKLKDEEIERLKADKECAKDVINWHEKECKQYIKLHHTKARSIVAMLFWEWRKSEARIYATNIKWKTGRAFQSQILFEAAYKILKEQQ